MLLVAAYLSTPRALQPCAVAVWECLPWLAGRDNGWLGFAASVPHGGAQLCVLLPGCIHNILPVGRMEADTWGQSRIKVWQQQNCPFCGETFLGLSEENQKSQTCGVKEFEINLLMLTFQSSPCRHDARSFKPFKALMIRIYTLILYPELQCRGQEEHDSWLHNSVLIGLVKMSLTK